MVSMQEKLKQDYERSQKQENLGHMIGFFIEEKEAVKNMYEFDAGMYTIRSRNGNFIWWNYEGEGLKEKMLGDRPNIHRCRRR